MLNYFDIIKHTSISSWTAVEIMTCKKRGFVAVPHTATVKHYKLYVHCTGPSLSQKLSHATCRKQVLGNLRAIFMKLVRVSLV